MAVLGFRTIQQGLSAIVHIYPGVMRCREKSVVKELGKSAI